VPARDEPDDMMGTLRSAIRSKDPTALTTLVSSMLAVTDRWSTENDGLDEPVALDALVDLLVDTPYAETTSTLHVLAALLPDELDAARVRRALATRRHPVPAAVLGVRDITVDRAAKLGDELGDGDNVILGLAWPGIGGVTVVVYVDEAFGTRVKDVFLVPEPFDVVCDRYRELLPSEGRRASELADITVADARASIQRAIDSGDADDALAVPDEWSGPDSEPLGWPTSRPFVEMLLRRMPAGGASVLTSSALPEVSVVDVVRGFLASLEAHGLDAAGDVEGAAFLLTGDAAAFGGHPLRWSPVQVELALTQRLPWSSQATPTALDGVEPVLPALIRYAHGRLAVPGAATAETLAAVEEWMPVFAILRSATSAVRWREMAPMIQAFEQGQHGPLFLHSLAEEVGGQEVLDALDAEPLPDEPLVIDSMAADVRDSATEIAALADAWLESSPRVSHLGALRGEWRTAVHRLLVGATIRDPGWLRRRASARGRACGLLWVTGIANHLVGPRGAVLVKDLASDFGVSGAPSTKAEALLRAWAGGGWVEPDRLGDAGLLVSTQRAEIIAARDRYRD
jgi:hypothetical protein